MRAVILAAGKGTRMGALAAETPKSLLEVDGRPILTHILAGLSAAGITDVVVVTGHLGERIEAALGDGRGLGVSLTFRRQERPEGTGRALLSARDAIGGAPFLLGWADILVEPGLYSRLLERFERRSCDGVIAVNPVDDPWRGAAVHVDESWRVESIVEKPPRGTSTTRWNNAGVHVFDPVLLEYAARLAPSARGEYELPQAFAAMVRDGRHLEAVAVEGFWSDVGTPDDLRAAEAALRGGGPR